MSKIKNGCQIEKGKKSFKYQKRVSNRKKKTTKKNAPKHWAVAVRRYCASCLVRRCCSSSSCCWSCASPSPSLSFIVVVLETVLFVLAVVCCSFARETRVGLGWVSPTPIVENLKKKTRYSAITAIPQRPPWLWQPPWCRHTQPATPPLFGGIFPKIRDAIPSWRRHNRFLITLEETKKFQLQNNSSIYFIEFKKALVRIHNYIETNSYNIYN